MTKDVNVVVMDFPNTKTKELVMENEDGTYTIFINSRLSYDGQLEAYKHAMKHINEDDFQKTDVQNIEAEAHSIIHSRNAKPIPSAEYESEIHRLRRQRRKLQRQMREHEKRLRFIIEECGVDLLSQGEHRRLYGDEL